MSEDKAYKDGDIVWVKLGNNWWPGEVTGPTRHPEGLLKHLKRVPYCVVKFFNENTYEYVRSSKQIFPFQCTKHDEFVRKGYSLYNSGNLFMEKFPADVEVAKQLVRRKESSLIINDRPDSIVKAVLGQPLVRTYDECYDSSEYREKRRSGDSVTKILNITPCRDTDASSQQSRVQTCDFCDFTSVRLNVMILHRKIHSNGYFFGSSKSASSKPISAKLTPNEGEKTTTNINTDSINKVQQNQILNNEKTSKAKASTLISTDALLLKRPSPPRISPMNKTRTSNSSNYEGRTTEISAIGKNNGNLKLATAKNKPRCTKKLSSGKRKEEENAYETILLDFCSSETEASPQSEEKTLPPSGEKASRRSLRHCKDMTLTATEKDSNICIDLSETKTIKKIPKKREYSTLQMENDSTAPIISTVVVTESDVVCIRDNEKQPPATSSAAIHTHTSKRDAEDIHRLLLADWSDDDETPADTIVTDVSIELKNSNMNVGFSAPLKDCYDSNTLVETSTPVVKPSSVTSGRIRNIPKKDRRDVVLQDFNSDLSSVQNANVKQIVKPVSVDLDSSNSSVVEIVEEQQPAAIITINDDEDQENSKFRNNHTDVIVTASKDNDSSICFINDKSDSSAKSTTILSCFDFQEDEDEQENAASIISHFKKKYLSGEKLQSLSLTTPDDIKEANVAKCRSSELAEKDQRLAADIETLLEQTRPKVSDLLSASSFEETLSVKDLPIKERGKRIFKSRNKIRMEDKVNSELVAPAAVSIPTEEQTSEGYTDVRRRKRSETVREQSVVDEEVDMSNQEVVNRNCFVEISSSSQTEIPKLLEDEQLTTNDNKDNKTVSDAHEVCSEISICNNNSYQSEQTENEKIVKFNITNENADGESPIEKKTRIEPDHHVCNKHQYKQLLDGQEDKLNQCQSSQYHSKLQIRSQIDQTEVPRQKNIFGIENIEKSGEICKYIETNKKFSARVDNNQKSDILHGQPPQFKDAAIDDIPVDRVKVLEVQIIKHTKEYFKNTETVVASSPNEMLPQKDKKELKIVDSKLSLANSKNENQKQLTESTFKIRVKSPEQLLNQAFVMSSQQETELQTANDVSVDARLASTTPTDENSSMCASDTGAEFGSPTSMLSDERLPAFRFQSIKTPEQEIETTGSAETKIENVPEATQEQSNICSDKSTTHDLNKEHYQKDKPKIYQGRNQKSLQQRRYSMDLNSLQTEPKLIKRQRLSADCITRNQENNFEKVEEKPLGIHQRKIEGSVRPKSRHMKITPRRNVSELFKEHIDKYIATDVKKSFLLESVKKTKSVNDIVSIRENKKLLDNCNITPVNELPQELLEKPIETNPQDKENQQSTSKEVALSKTTADKVSKSRTGNQELYKFSDENENELTEDRGYVGDKRVATEGKEPNSNSDVQSGRKETSFLTKEAVTDLKSIEETLINTEENQQMQLNSEHIHKNSEIQKVIKDIENQSILDESIVRNSNPKEKIGEDSAGNADVTTEMEKVMQHSSSISDMMPLLNNSATHNDQILEIPFSPGIPPSTPQEREVVVESENFNTIRSTQQEAQAKTREPSELTVHNKETDMINQPLTNQEKEQILSEKDGSTATPKENESFKERMDYPSVSLEKEFITGDQPVTNESAKRINECETAELIKLPQPLDIVIEFDNNLPMSCTAGEINVEDECEKVKQMPTTVQPKDLIIEIEPATPPGIIECDHNLTAQVAFEKEVIIENDIVVDKPTKQDIIIEENLQLEEGEPLLEREFQVIEPKGSSVSINIASVPETNSIQTDADKAAEEFLIEFDNIVNHSHTVEEGEQSHTVEDDINAEDLINNIIEEVHEDHQLKQNSFTKSVSPLQYEPLTTYTVVTQKNSWNQIFKDSFNRQLNPGKRRKTICFEISDKKEGVSCKKQAFDFESILPANKTIKRTSERKLTMPAIESKFSNSHQPHNILALNHSQLTVNQKFIPTAKRKLSIEDNITSFVIERPKQQLNAVIGPPPLQRIRPIRRQSNIISKSTLDNMTEPPPLQSQENLLNDFFAMESSSSIQTLAAEHKTEGERVVHQQFISGPAQATFTVNQNKSIDSKISINKQIGVDSRGNKYVIIKTPPTDIVVQPTLTSTTAAAIPATNNLGTSITIQPMLRSSSEIITTKPITKNKNNSRQQLQQQQMKQISNTVPANSPLEISNLPEISVKTASRNRRKGVQAKAITATSSNINSAKHRQAMEALSRRLSIASETPTLSKISRTSSNVKTQISSNSSLSSLFGDAQISNIAQQQLIQLQQQGTQSTPCPLPPPIILNKNAHQQSAIQRKTRKITSQQQTPATKLSQQQHQIHQQSQEIQQQFITQILQQPQTQEHNPFQPPPLQQLQPQTVPIQQQIVQQSDAVLITTPATEDDNVIDSISQLIALPTQPYPGYSETFLLCKVKGNTCKPVDNVPLYLNHQLNELVPVPLEAIESGHKTQEHQIKTKTSNSSQHLLGGQNNEPLENEANIQIANLNCNVGADEISAAIEPEHQMHQNSQIMEECAGNESGGTVSSNQINEYGGNQIMNTELVSNNGILLNIEGQQVLLDAATFAHLLANPDANTQLISDDGTEYVLTHEVLAALQIQQEQQQALELANAAAEQQQSQHLEQTAGNDIIAVALAGSDLYDNEVLRIDTSQGMQLIDGDGSSIVFPSQTGSITQQHLTPPAVVTNAVLDQSPIMSALEVPSSISAAQKLQGSQLITVPSHHLATSNAALGGRTNLEDSLAAIGVTTQSSSIPSSLGLPITVTNPNIASKVTSVGPLNEMLQFVSHRPTTAAATAAAVAAAALAGESRIFTD